MPNLLATGDDDGVVKVCVASSVSALELIKSLSRCGIREYQSPSASIPTTLIISLTFCGWKTRSTLFAPGPYYNPTHYVLSDSGSHSGDGTLSVLDVRSKKVEPFAQSEDQEDELLSIVAIKAYVYIVLASHMA